MTDIGSTAGIGAAGAIGTRRAEALAAIIEAEARADYPMLTIVREGAEVTLSGRWLARLRLDDPLLAHPALLAEAGR